MSSRLLKRVTSALLAAALLIPAARFAPATEAATPDIPVILYHQILPTASNDYATSLDTFKNEMKYLSDNGYDTLSAEQYVNILKGNEPAPDKPILLTFDDGTPDFVTNALPVLKQYAMKSVEFIVTDWIGGGYAMTTAQLQALASEPGVSLQNHTKTHDSAVWTDSITKDQAVTEIATANAYLKNLTGKDSILLAYPYGAFNANAQAAAQENGILYAFKVGTPSQGDYAKGRSINMKNTTVAQFAGFVGGPTPPDTSDSVLVYHEAFAGGKGAATQSGGASLTTVTGKAFAGNDDGAALYVSNRANNWDAVDFKFGDLGLENGKTYTVTVQGYVDADVTVPSGGQAYLQTVDSYAFLAGADFVPGSAFTLTKEFTVDTSKDSALRVQSSEAGKTVPFYIGDITVTANKPTTPTTETVAVYHEAFAGGKGAAAQSGGASLTPVTGKVFAGNEDGAALYVSNRANNWDAVDFKFSDLGLENGKTYTVTVKGYVDADVTVPSGGQAYLQTVNSYGFLAGADFVPGSAFTLTQEFTVDTSKDSALRVQSSEAGKTVPFYIGDMLITEKAASSGPTRPPALPFNAITFEDGTAGGFVGRAGTETLTVTDEANHTAGGSKALKVEGRTQAWDGPALRVEKYVDLGYEYTISVWVKLISPASSQLQLSAQIGQGSSASYNNILGKTISTADGWVLYEGKYRFNNSGDENLTIYIESTNNATASFYIDDVNFVKGSGPTAIQKNLTPIKSAYPNFLIGNAVSAADLTGPRLELLKMHHNIVTAENAMKPDATQAAKGVFTFADSLVDTAIAEGLKVHGHVLVWHQQTPAWMNTASDGNPLSRDEALANMRTHIQTVMEHYGDKVISWDVVNEAINDSLPNPSDWQASLRQSAWYKAIGPDYVEQAFLAAREVLDTHPDWNIKLYYNDYNEDNQNKATAIYNMVKAINDKYTLTHPGKLLIDGIGMQSHYNLNTNPENVKLSMEKFISLGVQISITELDIGAGTNSALTEKQANQQGYLYAQLFKLYQEHAANIGRVTFWGLNDATSWRASSSPLVFDKDLQAKPAYYGIINPDKFMQEHPPASATALQSTANRATPTVDGTVDAVWSLTDSIPVNRYQTAWQGANGTAKALWDEQNLYVLIQVSDAELDKASVNPWEQDSVEVFVDQNNAKSSSYQADDGQYRVNYDNEASFNPASLAAGFDSATTVSGTNYTVEMKIPLQSVTPAINKKLGFDVQINDGNNGSRESVAAWNDTTGNGYQDTSVFGVLTLKDTIAPTATVSYSKAGPTNENVIAAITPSEPVTVTNNNGKASYTFSKNGSFTFEFVDAAGNTGSATAVVSNIDKTAPQLALSSNPAALLTPNHKLVPVHVTWTATDDASGIASVKLVKVTSSEPDNGLGDGDTANDIQGAAIGTADQDILLRAERAGNGDGRVYTIVYEAVDLAGNKVTAQTTVKVPNNSSKN